MSGGMDNQRPSPAALLPMAIVAAVVLVLALTLGGGRVGTIVVERTIVTSTNVVTPQSGSGGGTARVGLTTITEANAFGGEQRSFFTDSSTRARYQQLFVGNSMQLYDPVDNTIYVTTRSAFQRKLTQQMVWSGKGSHFSIRSSVRFLPSSALTTPGRLSVFAQRLRAGLYRRAGRVRIDGRSALKLVPARSRGFSLSPDSATAVGLAGTVYVSPRTYDPIEEVVQLPSLFGADVPSTSVTDWKLYRVLPANAHNKWLVSLTLRHPHARVVRSVNAYLAAQRRESTIA